MIDQLNQISIFAILDYIQAVRDVILSIEASISSRWYEVGLPMSLL